MSATVSTMNSAQHIILRVFFWYILASCRYTAHTQVLQCSVPELDTLGVATLQAVTCQVTTPAAPLSAAQRRSTPPAEQHPGVWRHEALQMTMMINDALQAVTC